MSGAQIAREIDAALLEVAQAVGNGSFVVTLIAPTTQPVNPWSAPGSAPVEYEARAMVSSFPASLIDGTLIRREDRRFMLSAVEHHPDVSWRMRVDGVTYSIISVTPAAPSGVALYYDIQARA